MLRIRGLSGRVFCYGCYGHVVQAFRNCLKTRDTPNIVARLSVYAWKGTLTPTLPEGEGA